MWALIIIAVAIFFALAMFFFKQICQLFCKHAWQIEGWSNVEGNCYACFLCGKRSTDSPFTVRSIRRP